MKNKRILTFTVLFVLGVLGVSVDYFNLAHYTVSDSVSNLSLALLAVLAIVSFGDNGVRYHLKL